jgi:hypothetical protein
LSFWNSNAEKFERVNGRIDELHQMIDGGYNPYGKNSIGLKSKVANLERNLTEKMDNLIMMNKKSDVEIEDNKLTIEIDMPTKEEFKMLSRGYLQNHIENIVSRKLWEWRHNLNKKEV